MIDWIISSYCKGQQKRQEQNSLVAFCKFGIIKGRMLEVNNTAALPVEKIVDSRVSGNQAYVDAIATADNNGMFVMLWKLRDNTTIAGSIIIKNKLVMY